MKIERPTPLAALVVSGLALIAAVSSTAVAVVAGESGDKLIAKHTLSGDRLRTNTVTGAQIKESALGTVPKAAHLPALVWHVLVLTNGWQNENAHARPPAYAVDAQGIVHLRGAILNGTDPVFARLPRPVRPSADIWLATTLADGMAGRIEITPGGQMVAEAAGDFADAQQFTGLDSVTYALG
jgi:hypothetical protein